MQLAEPFVVLVSDEDGSPLAGVGVTFSVTAGGGTLSTTIDTTDANGRAATQLTLGNQLGAHTVTATVEGLGKVNFTAATIGQITHRLTKMSGDGQEGLVGSQLAEPFVVLVSDEDDEAIAGVVVSFTVAAGGGTLTDTTDITDVNGLARTTLTLGNEPGTNTVTATIEGIEPMTFTATATEQDSSFDSLFDFFQSGKVVALPDQTQLLQNAPNPFNSQTTLSYFLLEPGPARLEVLTLTGQRVIVLHQGAQQAGYHRLHWDGRDAAGHPVASGAYLYRLVTDEAVLTRKLILLR